jgi:putative flippase GtrA
MLNTRLSKLRQRVEASRDLVTKFGSFAFVGVVATAVQYILLIALVGQLQTSPVLASDIGFVASAVINYLLNYHLTFRSTKAHLDSGPKFMMVATLGLLLNSLVMHIGTQLLGLHHLVTQVIATIGVALWNFTGHHVWSFGAGSVIPGAGSVIPTDARGETQ